MRSFTYGYYLAHALFGPLVVMFMVLHGVWILAALFAAATVISIVGLVQKRY